MQQKSNQVVDRFGSWVYYAHIRKQRKGESSMKRFMSSSMMMEMCMPMCMCMFSCAHNSQLLSHNA